MPSPFPGMDPYLEGYYRTTLHSQLAPEFARLLAPLIEPKYVALTEPWYAISSSAEELSGLASPDVSVSIVRETAVAYDQATTTPPTRRVTTVVPIRSKQVRVAIREVGNLRLVTAIELLSPANKTGSGRAQYLRKRERLLRDGANFVEVDLLHEGRRIPARPRLPRTAYLVAVTRSSSLLDMDLWEVAIAEALPTIPIPLQQHDPDVPLYIQTAFSTVYDIVGYRRIVEYYRRPPVRMPSEELQWSRELLAKNGIDVSRWDSIEPAP